MEQVVLVIAAPGSRAIDENVIESLRALGSGPPRWLAPDEAVEFDQFEGFERFDPGSKPLDLASVPRRNRRKHLLLADMDSTMIAQECIDELGALTGLGDKISAITARAMRGEIDFAQSLRQRVALLKGLDAQVIGQILRERITLAPGGATLVATMKAHGAYTALVSGGFLQFTRAVAAQLGFDHNEANDLVIEDGRLTGDVREPVLGAADKLAALRRIVAERGLDAADAIAAGDGANDIPMLKGAGMGVAVHAKPHVQEQAPIRINHGDLTALLYLQGYRKDAFRGGRYPQ